MPYYKFQDADLFYNRVKTYPKVEFKISRGPGGIHSKVHYNNQPHISGAFAHSVTNNTGRDQDTVTGMPDGTDSGYINLYEVNVDRFYG